MRPAAAVVAQCRVHLAGRGPALRLLRQTAAEQRPQFGVRDTVQSGLVVDGAVQQRVHGAGTERRASRGRVRQHAPQGEDIARRAHPLRPRLLGREETGGADHHVVRGQLGLVGRRRAGDAEVDQARSVEGEQDVARLDIPVDQTRPVHGGQGSRQYLAQHPYRTVRQRAAGRDRLLQGRSGHERGGQPGRGRLRVGAHHPHHPGAVDLSGDGRLTAEASPELGLVGVLGLDHLHRGQVAGPGASQIDDAHAAGSQTTQEAVAAEAGGVGGQQSFHHSPPFLSSTPGL